MMNKLKYKYDLTRDTKGFLIASINDNIVWFAAKVLASKLVWKIRPNECMTKQMHYKDDCSDKNLCGRDSN